MGTALLAIVTAGSGCGPQTFIVTRSLKTQVGPGHFMVPPKVDILMAEDDTGSMNDVYSQISSQMPGFLDSLESKRWDYHFTTIPLTTDRTLSMATASKYDANWGSQWIPSFPGATITAVGSLSANIFKTLSDYQSLGFLTTSDVNNSLNGWEPGLSNIHTALTGRMSGTGFLRSDALLVIFAISNGNDTSGVTICKRNDGYQGACGEIGFPNPATSYAAGTVTACYQNGNSVSCPSTATDSSSLTSYKTSFQALKANANQVQFHAAVSNGSYTNCLGGRAYKGSRYQDMATQTGGKSYDICSQGVTSVLDQLGTQLQGTKLAFRMRYLFLDEEPDQASIIVTKFANGDASQSSVIPQDATNGWTYAGNVTNVYAIDLPVNMNLTSGIAIELHGTAKLLGNDSATVDYKPAGAQNVTTQ